MKERKHDSPNFFPRLPFTILAIAGIVILAANAVLTYTLEEYPLFIGIGMFLAYSLAAVIIITVQTSKYKFINKVNEKTAAFNTEIINMFIMRMMMQRAYTICVLISTFSSTSRSTSEGLITRSFEFSPYSAEI